MGICGTAMATLAAMLSRRGVAVRGSDDQPYPPMSTFLGERGIEIRSPYAAANLEPRPDLVVVGNAISRGNPELEAALDAGLPCRSMPEVLRDAFLEGSHPVVIAGTHGKTTTAAMTAVALSAAGLDPSAFVGGYVLDLDGPFRLGAGAPFVIEGDEYDTAYFDKAPKFLKYQPRTLVIGNLEFDHADIYDDLEAIQVQFRRLVNLVPRSGLVLVGDASPAAQDVVTRSHAPVVRFGLDAASEWRAVELSDAGDGTTFRVIHEGRDRGAVAIPQSGAHNVRNALAALAVGVSLGGDFARLAAGLRGMRGVKRRLEAVGERAGVLVYDDFAHHPTAIRETLRAVRARHPGRRVWAVFEPRSWTNRRNVHQAELGQALAEADLAVMAPVFQPERVPDGVRLREDAVVADVVRRGVPAVLLAGATPIATHVAAEARPGDVVVVMSNGGFDGVHGLILGRLGASRP
jgi:UDP-N-acetylmuramate: L-alanyl-gamma-D-glutamyl-meso-diaminopimelate ligase